MNSKLYVCIFLSLFLTACNLDNFQAPNAELYGSVIDEDTNEPILQDLIEGSRIDFVEQGFENTSIRQIRFHVDGSFHETNLFSGTYLVQALRGNFFPTQKDMIEVDGKTKHDFRSRPYIRIHDVELSFDEIRGEVTAGFTLEQVSENPVASVHLIADRNPNLSYYLQRSIASKDVNFVVAAGQKFQVKLSTEDLDSGKEYYFRVAALISGIGEAKHNYSKPVRMFIDNSQVIPDMPIPGKVIDACESLEGWSSWLDGFPVLDKEDKKEGESSVRVDCFDNGGNTYGAWIFEKTCDPFDSEVSKEYGFIAFDLFVSEASNLTVDAGMEFSIKSGGSEIKWGIRELGLKNGWNKVELSLDRATDDFDLHAITYLGFMNHAIMGPLVVKIDHIRFYEK